MLVTNIVLQGNVFFATIICYVETIFYNRGWGLRSMAWVKYNLDVGILLHLEKK